MARHKVTRSERTLPKIWVVRLRALFEAELWQLNAQLTLPPDESRPFVFGHWPHPLDKTQAPTTFDLALRRGNDPDTFPYLEPEGHGELYNLYLRVAEHVPFSEDWLFKPLLGYLSPELPGIDDTSALIARLLERLRMRRMGNDAICFAIRERPDAVLAYETSSLRALSQRPDPLHLMLLIALFHERQWHFPSSPEARGLDHACCAAIRNFVGRQEFRASAAARILQADAEEVFRQIVVRIRHDGHHSAPPARVAPDWLDPAPLRCADVGARARRFVIYEPFAAADEADLCVGLGYSVSIAHLLRGRASRYAADAIPTRSESLEALDHIFHAAEIPIERWSSYERDPEVLGRLQSDEAGMPYTSAAGSPRRSLRRRTQRAK